jgi:hypothetical protein
MERPCGAVCVLVAQLVLSKAQVCIGVALPEEHKVVGVITKSESKKSTLSDHMRVHIMA